MKKAIILMALSTTLLAALTPGDQKAAQIKFPENLTYATSVPESYPRLFLTPQELAARRAELKAGNQSLKTFLEQRQKVVTPLMEMDDAKLRSLFPPVGQPVVYGLGMSLDPQGTILKWAGFQNPHCVIGKDNVVYPNEQFPDDGNGWKGPDGKKCYFRARAAGFLYAWLENMLVALGDCYALSGDSRYAHTAAVLLDALAPNYAADKRGPLDYPTSPKDMERGGRLNRPYYQVARGLMNYIWCFELIMPSGELGLSSHVAPNQTIFDNVARNLLFNGGIYCLGYTLDGYQLHNGHADYLRGNASVGLMLNLPEMVAPLFDSAIGFQTMLDVSIDRDSFYVESSHMYSTHTLTLYMDLADMQEAAVRLGMPGATPIYDSPAFFNLLFRYFDRAEVGGRLPRIGDDGPDRLVSNPTNLRAPTAAQPNIDVALRQQLSCIWYLWTRVHAPEHKRQCAEFLRAAYGDAAPEVSNLQHLPFRVSQEELATLKKLPLNKSYFDSRSVLYGGKGYAILRGGTPEASHGLQLLCGALHNHSQCECLSWIFFNKGAEWSYDPGYYNTHYRFGWTLSSVSHNQVTFNAKNANPSGIGEVLAWQTEGSAQYVYASNPEGYAEEGATRYERFIAQADAPDRSLDYWLDVSIAQGGNFRDDSFHTVMTNVETDLEFNPMPQFAMGGDRFKGQHFLPDYRLSGETDKAFYWNPEGDGYTLLVEPAKAVPAGDGTLRMRFTQAGFPLIAELKQILTVDFPGKSGREYYRTYPMKAYNAAYVPYILRRDHGPGISVFAKVLHFADEDAPKPRVSTVKSLAVSPDEESVAAYEIILADGRRDIWFIGNKKPHSFTAHESSALVEVWRYNADGLLHEHHASGNAAEGTIDSVAEKNGKVVLTVKWNQEHKGTSSGLLVSYGAGRPANWAVDAVKGNTITLTASKNHIGRLHFKPVGDGRYVLRPVSSFFFGRGGKQDSAYIQGRHILDDSGKVVSQAQAFGAPENSYLTVVLSTPIPEGFYRIAEIAPGDTFRLE